MAVTNNQATAANVGTGASALSFPTASVRSFVVSYAVTRGTFVEAGEMEGVFNGSAWSFAHNHVDCAGMCFQITAAGQVQYFSSGDSCCGIITGGVTFLCCTANTVTRTCGSWITDGFFVGAGLTVASSEDAGNNCTYTVSAITALVLTVACAVTNTSCAPDTTATFVQTRGAGTVKFRARTIDQ